MDLHAPDRAVNRWLSPFPDCAQEIVERRAQFFPATAERAAAVTSLLPSWEVEDLALDAGDDPIAWFRTREGKHRTTRVRAHAAGLLHEAGITLYLRKLRRLESLQADIARALGMPATYVDCSVFCSQPGASTQPHFDSVATLTVQVKGSKTWHIAPNTHAPQPTETWVTREEVSHELRLYAHEPFPPGIPDHLAETHRLEPGAMLYVPRGYWHDTLSSEESIALHIHLQSCPWADVVTKTLRAQLLRDEAWRSTAYTLWGHAGPHSWDAAAALEALRRAVARLSVDDLQRPAPWLPGPADRVISRARSAMGVVSTDNGRHTVRLSAEEFGLEDATTVEMSQSYLAATLLVARSREPLSAQDLAAHVPELSLDEALGLVHLLCDSGYARRASER
ncbi:JmjC domain-containing protein [Pendulispora albinea]|uniref:Cupin domain-containing protein n=1 Tax=Pendulispora albinea TaxID=2741071 RepID=A0ABZ2LYD6_9BACT